MTKLTQIIRGGLRLALIAGSLTVVATGCRRGAVSQEPPIHLNPNMDNQEKFLSQSENDFFANGSTMREPVPGTVARGWLGVDDKSPVTLSITPRGMLFETKGVSDLPSLLASPDHVATIMGDDLVTYYTGRTGVAEDAPWVERSPVPYSPRILARGQDRYNIYCLPCHGSLGDGHGVVGDRSPVLRPNPYTTMTEYPDGRIYSAMANGYNNMPSYAHQIPVADRWAIVSYVRALQRSQNADITDVPENQRGAVKP